jgi:hypothetical protein
MRGKKEKASNINKAYENLLAHLKSNNDMSK